MHQTVFLQTAIDFLQIEPGKWYLDATFGAGGHSQEIIRRGGKVLAFEYEEETFSRSQEAFQKQLQEQQLILIRQNFVKLEQTVADLSGFGADFRFAGMLFDLGTSSDQLMSADKGLSFQKSGPLDMRLDSGLAVTARDLLLVLNFKQLQTLFFEFGGEREAKKIAQAIINYRQEKGQNAFQDALELSELVKRTKRSRSKLHPATKVFQALRIAVNSELDNLQKVLPQAFKLLAPGGRLVTIAFHEGEDRLVKHFFSELQAKNLAQPVFKKPLVPDKQELSNPRARSAKLRVLEKND